MDTCRLPYQGAIIPASNFFQISFCLYFSVIEYKSGVDRSYDLFSWNELQNYIHSISNINLEIKEQDDKVFMTLNDETLCEQDISETDFKHLRAYAHCPCDKCYSDLEVTSSSQNFKNKIKQVHQKYVIGPPEQPYAIGPPEQPIPLALNRDLLPLLEALEQDLGLLPKCDCAGRGYFSDSD